jgi:predicted TIM-barrel fold metal-dependent hydrolase
MGGEEYKILKEMNCYYDISFASNRLWRLTSSQELEKIIRDIGIEKCCFGTDYPVNQYSTYYNKLNKCNFTQKEISKISKENILNFLKIMK